MSEHAPVTHLRDTRSRVREHVFSTGRGQIAHRRGRGGICVAVDTSGSIGPGELAQFTAEADSIKAQIPARLTVLACDERMDERGPWRFQAWEPLSIPVEWRGGGGTSFVPVFDWAAREGYRPDVLVYFTDAQGDFPEAAPDFPVMWLVKGNASVPWGERIQLD